MDGNVYSFRDFFNLVIGINISSGKIIKEETYKSNKRGTVKIFGNKVVEVTSHVVIYDIKKDIKIVVPQYSVIPVVAIKETQLLVETTDGMWLIDFDYSETYSSYCKRKTKIYESNYLPWRKLGNIEINFKLKYY